MEGGERGYGRRFVVIGGLLDTCAAIRVVTRSHRFEDRRLRWVEGGDFVVLRLEIRSDTVSYTEE